MKKTFITVISIAILTMSCKPTLVEKTKLVYPLRHHTKMYADENNLKKPIAELQWGDILEIDKNTIYTYTNNITIYYWVKRKSDGKKGFVKKDNIIENAIHRGVALNKTVIYVHPTLKARNWETVYPPVLMYITEIKTNNEGDWAKVSPYNTSSFYNINLSNTELAGYEWIHFSKLSTNNADIKIIKAMQIVLNHIRQEKIKSRLSEEDLLAIIENEITQLQEVMHKYPKSTAILYARQAIDVLLPEENTELDPLLGDDDESNESDEIEDDTNQDDDDMDTIEDEL